MTPLARLRRRIAPRVARDASLVLGGLAGFVVAGLRRRRRSAAGPCSGSTSSPDVALSVAGHGRGRAGFDPVQTRLEALASRVVHGGRPSPYDVLRRFSGDRGRRLRRGGAARADGPGAGRRHRRRVGAGLAGGGRPADAGRHLAARRAVGAGAGRRRTARRPAAARQVRHGGELLGRAGRAGACRGPADARSRSGCSPGSPPRPGWCCAAPPARRARAAAGRAVRPRRGAAGLAQRLVDAQDAERRRAGARHPRRRPAAPGRAGGQPAARRRRWPTRSPERADALLAAQEDAAAERRSRRSSSSPAASTRRCSPRAGSRPRSARPPSPARSPVELDADGVGRYPPGVEAAAYFCCLEALQNAAKHAGRRRASGVDLRGDGGRARCSPSRTTAPGFDPRHGRPAAGLANMRDRVESVGGTLHDRLAAAAGTRVRRRAPGRPAGAEVRAPRRLGAGRRSPLVLMVADIVVTAPYRPLLSEDGGGACTASRSSTARCSARRVLGALDRLALRAAPDRLAAEPGRRRPAPSRCSPRPTASGCSEATGPGRQRSAACSAWLSALLGGQLAIGGLALMFLLAPDGHLLSRRWRYALAAVPPGAARAARVALLTGDPTDVRPRRTPTSGPVRGAMFTARLRR